MNYEALIQAYEVDTEFPKMIGTIVVFTILEELRAK